MQTYDSYKDSGIDWVGEIPSHWEVKKITHLFSKIGSGTTPTAGLAQYYENGTINFLQTGDLNDNLIDNTSKKITEKALRDNSSLKIYPKGSLVIAMYGATVGKLGILDIETTTNQACCVLGDNNKNLVIKYIFYWFSFAKKQIISMSYGGGQPNISQDLIKSLRLNFPPLHEQEAIARFLDDKCAKIDELVAIKEQQIDKLKELRQAKIHLAVTKGINPNVEMKNSGIDWIGEIPKHWEVGSFKFVTEFILDGTHGSFPRQEKGYRLLSVRNIINDRFVFRDDDSFISENDFYSITSKFLNKEGDILLTIVGGTLGKAALLSNLPEKFATQRSLATIRVNKYNFNKYYYYYIISKGYQNFLWSNTNFSAQPGIYLNTLYNSQVPILPLSEQEAIVAYLDQETNKIDQAIAQREAQIEKLKAYKQSLINEVVTGKIRVA